MSSLKRDPPDTPGRPRGNATKKPCIEGAARVPCCFVCTKTARGSKARLTSVLEGTRESIYKTIDSANGCQDLLCGHTVQYYLSVLEDGQPLYKHQECVNRLRRATLRSHVKEVASARPRPAREQGGSSKLSKNSCSVFEMSWCSCDLWPEATTPCLMHAGYYCPRQVLLQLVPGKITVCL